MWALRLAPLRHARLCGPLRGARRGQVTEANLEKLIKKLKASAESGDEGSFDLHELSEPLQRAGPLFYAAERHPELQVRPCPFKWL